MPRIRASATALLLVAAGCAAEDPWLAPRGPVRNLMLVGEDAPAWTPAPARFTAPVPTPQFARGSGAAAPVPMRPPSADGSEIARLNAGERRLWERTRELDEARDRAVALLSALRVMETQPSEHHRDQAESALRAYKESPAVRKFGAVALGLSLAACSSVGREIRSLNAEERELSQQISVLQDARKANIALVSALQQLQRDGSAKSQATVAKLREAHETAMDKVP